jgi:mannose/fructose/N-acetylgalactosamine-specific phosphotransferase system component IIB
MVRVDDRLLHGQVVLGWGQILAPRAYLIADDQAATDPWEREAFASAAPPGVELRVLGLEAFARGEANDLAAEGTVVLVRGLPQVAALVARGFRPRAGVNLGGLHARGGSREILPYVHLTPGDEQLLASLLAAGVSVYAQDLPGSARYEGEALRRKLARR